MGHQRRLDFAPCPVWVSVRLMLSGVLTVGESLSGFGSSVVILVAGLLVVGEMLARTGVARAVGDWILKKGGSNGTLLLIYIMLGAAVLGAVMSGAAVVAIFIPIVLRVAAQTNINPSHMLMPMSYAALIAGMLTLIATTPNIVVHEELKAAGFEGFGFFSFTLVGVAVLVAGMIYVLVLGRRLLSGADSEEEKGPRRRTTLELFRHFGADDRVMQLQIAAGSPMVGKAIGDTELDSRYGARIHGIARGYRRGEKRIYSPSPDTILNAEDLLLIIGRPEYFGSLVSDQALKQLPASDRDRQLWLWELGGAAVLVHPDSNLVGKSIRDSEFRHDHNLDVIGMKRSQEPIAEFEDVSLQPGDSLLVVGRWSRINHLQAKSHDFVVLEMPSEYADVAPSYRRMPVALTILAAMVLLTIFDVVALVAAVLLAAIAAGATRCLTMSDAYRAIHWSSLVLIAGMLPLADALSKTGGTQMIVDALLAAVGDASPYKAMTLIFFLTATLGLVLSNTASAVLVAPIAIYMADALGLSPYPFAVSVLIAASAAYSTPISTPVVTLVVEPGRYKFGDFVKVGVPLLFVTYLVTLVVTPLIFPFH